MTIRAVAFLSLLRMAAASALLAQPQTSLVPFESLVDDIRSDMAVPTDTIEQKKSAIAASLRANTRDFALYALSSAVYASLVEENRLDKQVGASAASAGSTSLVSRGSVPSLIGLAVEGGALYQSVSGNVVTFRLNPSGLARALARNSYLAAGPARDASVLERGISRLSASVSFDFQQGSSPGTFTGERSQLQEAAVRFDILNKRDPRHPSHSGAIQKLSGEMGPLVSSLTEYFTVLRQLPGYDAWIVATAERLAGADLRDDAALRAVLIEVGEEFKTLFASNPDLQRLGGDIVAGIKSYRMIRDQVFQSIEKSPILTFEYAFHRPAVPDAALASLSAGSGLPDLSTGRLIFSSPLGAVGEATLNGSVTIFSSAFPEMRGNLRDVQVAGSLDFRLPEIQSVGKPVLTFAGLAAFLHQQPFGVKVRVRDVETADGVIGVLQTKLTFPVGRNGVKIPVSFSVANRSEFNTEREIRGSIGVTFDLDTLFSR